MKRRTTERILAVRANAGRGCIDPTEGRLSASQFASDFSVPWAKSWGGQPIPACLESTSRGDVAWGTWLFASFPKIVSVNKDAEMN